MELLNLNKNYLTGQMYFSPLLLYALQFDGIVAIIPLLYNLVT